MTTVYNQGATSQLQNHTYGAAVLHRTQRHIITFEKPDDTADASVFRLGSFSTSLIPCKVVFMCDAIAGLTSVDLGFYKRDGGAVLDKDALMAAQDVHAGTRTLDGMGAVDISNLGKTIADLLAATLSQTAQQQPGEVDLAITMNTAGTAAGTITVMIDFMAN